MKAQKDFRSPIFPMRNIAEVVWWIFWALMVLDCHSVQEGTSSNEEGGNEAIQERTWSSCVSSVWHADSSRTVPLTHSCRTWLQSWHAQTITNSTGWMRPFFWRASLLLILRLQVLTLKTIHTACRDAQPASLFWFFYVLLLFCSTWSSWCLQRKRHRLCCFSSYLGYATFSCCFSRRICCFSEFFGPFSLTENLQTLCWSIH